MYFSCLRTYENQSVATFLLSDIYQIIIKICCLDASLVIDSSDTSMASVYQVVIARQYTKTHIFPYSFVSRGDVLELRRVRRILVGPDVICVW